MAAKVVPGMKFGRLTVLERVGTSSNGSILWLCRCDCGGEKITATGNLVSQRVKSCGCLQAEVRRKNGQKTEHGDTKGGVYQRLYFVWCAMKRRCQSPNSKDYPNYGGRGIQICPEWSDYQTFKKWAIAAGYDPKAPHGACTLDRIDCNKGYSPDNCRWVDMKTQAHNRRSGRGINGQYTAAPPGGTTWGTT